MSGQAIERASGRVASKRAGERAGKRAGKRASKRVGEWASEWASEWAGGWEEESISLFISFLCLSFRETASEAVFSLPLLFQSPRQFNIHVHLHFGTK